MMAAAPVFLNRTKHRSLMNRLGLSIRKKMMRRWLPPWKRPPTFYHDLLMSNEDRFKPIWEYLARRGVDKETIGTFNIGYAPPYSDEQHHGRALIDGFLPHVGKGR
jgi:DNA primase